MEDDPERDLFPVKDGSYVESYRSLIAMTTDLRERHTISKIDRDDLEDKYLRLLEECQELRKLSNSQEDKIKRLGTKLMRVSATPRTFIPASLDANSDKDRMEILKMENMKLKDKIVVLRNQILSHRVLRRSPSQTRRLTICTSSRPTTCRSESGRIKSSACQNFLNDRDNDTLARTYVNKIGELEEQRKQMIARIAELENKIAVSQAEIRKDKIAENVECIRVRREMKLGHEKLIEAEATKKVLCAQIQEMKTLLDETMKNNGQITAALDTEKKKISEMDGRVNRSQDNQLREKDEQIRDLTSEMKILQQHNSELLNLSTKYSQLEIENIELKKKLSELLAENQNLKSSFSNEQVNMKALQAANEQLMEKLQSTQFNIDNLTVQLKSMQNQHRSASKNNSEVELVRKEIVNKIDKQTSTTSLLSACKSIDVIHQKGENSPQKIHPTGQNEIRESPQQSSSPIRQNGIRVPPEVEIETRPTNRPKETPATNTFENGKNNLSRDEMLKLLDEAQINTPLNTKSAISVRQIEDLNPKNYANANYRQSSRSVHSPPSREAFMLDKIRDQDHRGVIQQIYKILEDYLQNYFSTNDEGSKTKLRLDLLANPNKSVNVEQPSTNDRSAISAPAREPYDVYDHNNNTMPMMHDDNTKNPSTHDSHDGWGSEDGMMRINMTTIYHEYEESEGFIGESTGRCYEYCLGSTDKKQSGRKISHHSFLTAIDDINATLQKTKNDNRTLRPMSKTKQLETGLCCEPDNQMKDKYLKSYHILMDEASVQYHQAATSPKKSPVSRQSRAVVKDETNDDMSHIVEKEGHNGNILDTSNRYSPILITDQEGLIEIHILSLQFSSLVEDSLFNKNGNIIKRSLFVSCECCGKEPISTSVIEYPELDFNSSCIYRVTNLDEFFDNISHEYVYLQLHIAFHKDLSYVIAHGKINVGDIPIYPQNKLHYIVNMESFVPCYQNKKFGQLSLWIRLRCNTNRVKLFKERKQSDESHKNFPISREANNDNTSGNILPENNEPSNTVIEMIHERRSKTPKCPISTSNELNSIVRPFDPHKGSNDLRDGKTPTTSKIKTKTQFTDQDKNPWQPRQQSNHVQQIYYETGNSLPNTKTGFTSGDNSDRRQQTWSNNDMDDGNDAIVIMIERLKLVQNCSLFHNPDIHRLYVEFSFLGKYGVDCETISVPIPKSHSQNMNFNYVKKFRLDELNHSTDRNHLRSILFGEENPNVQFNVVSEPLIDEMETEECIDVGHTYLNLKDHILNNCGPDIFLTVRNPENTESIGVLKISILGANAIRQSLSKSPTIEET